MPADHEWRNLAEDAVDELFKAYIGDQVLMVVRSQIDIAHFITNVTAAKDKRTLVLDAINGI